MNLDYVSHGFRQMNFLSFFLRTKVHLVYLKVFLIFFRRLKVA
jgi:hypothetical protein